MTTPIDLHPIIANHRKNNPDARIDLLTVLAEKYDLPEGFDTFGLKSVRPDLRTRKNFRYPYPGGIAAAANMLDHDDSCPHQDGDGLCVGLTWEGMASSGIPARTLLLVAYRSAEARGNTSGKKRVPEMFVVDVIDGEALLKHFGRGADLRGADLRGADLLGANLRGADLRGANLLGANLRGAVNLDRRQLSLSQRAQALSLPDHFADDAKDS